MRTKNILDQAIFAQGRLREDDRRYLTEKQVAHRLGCSKKVLQTKRQKGGGIPFHKMFGKVMYAIADVAAFECSTRRLSTSDSGLGHTQCTCGCAAAPADCM